MLTFSSSQLREKVKQASPDSAEVAQQVDKIDFLEFGDLEGSVKDDVKFLKENPLVLPESTVSGWVYEVETGKVSGHLSDKIETSTKCIPGPPGRVMPYNV
jgi:carbonic anhydrase